VSVQVLRQASTTSAKGDMSYAYTMVRCAMSSHGRFAFENMYIKLVLVLKLMAEEQEWVTAFG